MKLTYKILFFTFIIYSSSCLRLPKTLVDSDDIDAICGEMVIWHIHLQNGFNQKSVEFLIGNDTIPNNEMGIKLNVNSEENKCAKVTLSTFRKMDNINLLLNNMPNFTLLNKNIKVSKDSLNISILIDGKEFFINESLKKNNFFGLNFCIEDNKLNVVKGKSCFKCLNYPKSK